MTVAHQEFQPLLRRDRGFWDNGSEPTELLPAGWWGGIGNSGITDLGIQLIHDEVAQGGFEEILLGAVLEQRVIHGVCSHLDKKNMEKRGRKGKPGSNQFQFRPKPRGWE